MPLPLEPDADALTIDALKSEPAITSLVATRIYDRIPDSPTWPLLTVTTVSDLERADPIGWEVIEQVDVFGESGTRQDTYDARTIARIIRAHARDMAGTYTSGTVSVCNADQIRDLGPDPDTGRAHFAVDLTLTIYQ
jgi:hypothetical protein